MMQYPDPYHPWLDEHFAIQSRKCGLRDHRFDFVASLSNLGPEFREFSQSLGFYEPYVSSGWGQNETQAFGERSYFRRTHESNKLIWEHYTEDLMLKVFNYYKDDFLNFGFSLDLNQSFSE